MQPKLNDIHNRITKTEKESIARDYETGLRLERIVVQQEQLTISVQSNAEGITQLKEMHTEVITNHKELKDAMTPLITERKEHIKEEKENKKDWRRVMIEVIIIILGAAVIAAAGWTIGCLSKFFKG